MAEIFTAKTQDQLYNAMERYLIGRLSSLNNFTRGSRTRTLLEAVAQITADTQFDFWSAMRTAIPVSAVEGFGFTRKAGTQSIGKLTFTRNTNAPQTYPIPAGTRVVLGNFEYESTASASIPIGTQTSGEIDARCVTVGDSDIGVLAIDTENGLGTLISPPAGVQFAKNDSAFTGGTDEETNDSRMERFKLYVQNLARCPVNGVLAGALTVDTVRSASIRERYPAPGWNTVYVDDGSGTVPTAVRDEVLKVINGDVNDPENYWGYRAAGLLTDVVAPTVVSVAITCDLKVPTLATSLDADLISAVTTAFDNYLNSLQLGNDVIFTELVYAAQNANPDVYDVTFTLPASVNVTITTSQVAKRGTTNITVTRGAFPS
jgi:uncharacterized phage protein gp47/JayE